ncbi:ribosome-associated toxin RatA of RatAB toxin-antitoxin module [Pseudomonas sp. W4I3]|nr:ribosome-associated toxin RatA of RatAB toxin-antitoxin module [Pseudomonas sp. W4I3]
MTTHIQRSALLPYPAQALYDLVNDVARYPEFLPWCSTAEVLESGDEHMVASVGVAKGGLSQHFVTRNVLVPGKSIEMNLQEGPFTQLQWCMGIQGADGQGLQDQPGPVVRLCRPHCSGDVGTFIQSGGEYAGGCVL